MHAPAAPAIETCPVSITKQIAPPGISQSLWLRVVPRTRIGMLETGFVVVTLLVHGLAVYFNSRGGEPALPQIPKWFDAVFGIPSPTGGTTRSILALDRGEILVAFAYNPIAMMYAALGAVFVAYFLWSLFSRREVEATARLRRVVFWSSFLGLLVTWILKVSFAPQELW